MKSLDPDIQPALFGVDVPMEFYWVLPAPAPLAGMSYPKPTFPWFAVQQTGFRSLVSLHPGTFEAAPIVKVFSKGLQDLVRGGPPADVVAEEQLVAEAVGVVLRELSEGRGVLVHCVGGRGRTGTVIGCALRALGYPADDVLAFMNAIHKSRNKPGWPESRWQGALVRDWQPGA